MSDGSEHIDLERSVGHGCGWHIVYGCSARDFYARISIAEPSYFASDVEQNACTLKIRSWVHPAAKLSTVGTLGVLY